MRAPLGKRFVPEGLERRPVTPEVAGSSPVGPAHLKLSGLSIVSSLVDAHNGTVRAESDGANQGATFTVSLPMIARENVRPALAVPDGRPEPDLNGARVLIVDDDDASRRLMITTLESAGAEVRECLSAGEAYDAVTAWLPHILITDLAMPNEDGYSLIRRIRETGNDVPAVAITAYVRSEDEIRVRDAGFQQHIAKPFDPAHLVQAVRELSTERGGPASGV